MPSRCGKGSTTGTREARSPQKGQRERQDDPIRENLGIPSRGQFSTRLRRQLRRRLGSLSRRARAGGRPAGENTQAGKQPGEAKPPPAAKA
jgi:hypothetical protein